MELGSPFLRAPKNIRSPSHSFRVVSKMCNGVTGNDVTA